MLEPPMVPASRGRASFRLRVLVVGLAVAVLTSAGPARANSSAAGIAQNAWLVTDLAGEVANKAQTLPYDPVLEAELATAAAATTKTTAKPGVTVKPKPSGKLGLIVNTVAMLGGFALSWGGGGETLPSPPAGEGAQQGTGGCGWASGGVVITGCTTSSVQFVMNFPTASGRSGFFYSITHGNWTSGSWNNGQAGSITRPATRVEYHARYGTSKDMATTTKFGTLWINPPASSGSPTWSTNPSPGTTPAPNTVPRRIESKAECRGKDGTLDVLSQLSEAFTIDPAQPKELPEAPDLQCAPGRWLEKGTRELVTEGTTEKMPLTEPYTSPPWVEQQVTNFPDCFPAGAGKCVLELIRKATATSPELNCNSITGTSGHPCRDWMSDPQKADRYVCRFGGSNVALRRCEPYAKAFTATPQIAPTPADPDGAPTPAPVTGSDPTPQDTPNLGSCVPGWSELLSPWWVFKAASCSLAWAFKPQTALAPRVAQLKALAATKAPFTWIAGFGSIPAAVPDNGCPDWRVKVAGLDKNVVCDSSYTGAIRTARPVLTVFMLSLALWPLLRSTAYAAIPILKPTPGKL